MSAQEAAERHVAAMEAAEAAARQAREQLASLETQLELEQGRASGLQHAVDSLRQQLKEAEQALAREKGKARSQTDALAAQLHEHHCLAAAATEHAAGLRQQLLEERRQLELEQQQRREVEAQLAEADEVARAREGEVEQLRSRSSERRLRGFGRWRRRCRRGVSWSCATAACGSRHSGRERRRPPPRRELHRSASSGSRRRRAGPPCWAQLREADGRLEALDGDCRSLVAAQQQAEEARSAAEGVMREQEAALAHLEQRLHDLSEQVGGWVVWSAGPPRTC